MTIEISGLAVPYGVPVLAREGDDYWTSLALGAFAESIAEPLSRSRVEAWIGHQRNAVIARRCEGDIRLSETDEGLRFLLYVDDRRWADMIWQSDTLGQLHGVSIGWKSRHWRTEGNTRVVVAADLIEVSLVLFKNRPKFPGTWARVTKR